MTIIFGYQFSVFNKFPIGQFCHFKFNGNCELVIGNCLRNGGVFK